MTPTAIRFAGETLLLDPAGAIVWPAARTLVVSDLHLEKGSSFAGRGQLLPPWDTRVTLARLAAALARHRPRTVIALGDSFHDRHASARLDAADAAALAAMTEAARFVWVLGNHDPVPPARLRGHATAEHRAGPLVFRHQAILGTRPAFPPSELCGHHHPKARVLARGGWVSRPCFLADDARLMLPAFGAYTGGLDVRDRAIAGLFPAGADAYLLGRDRLFAFRIGVSAAA